jgi:putative secretion activating protein
MDRFERIFDYLLKVEGGYTNDKNDKGGETTWGITKEEARDFGYKGDMRDMPLSIARDIYDKKYYHKNGLDILKSDKIALSVCDFIVNSGAWGAKKAQAALNELGFDLRVDGILGEKSLAALNEVDEAKFLEKYHDLQRRFYRVIVANKPSQKVFLKGWLNRVDKKEKYLKEMV